MATINMGSASRQWANRPEDERFLSLDEMADALRGQRAISHAKAIPSRALRFRHAEHDPVNTLLVEGQNGRPAEMTHWAFGQACQLAGAPASWLRKLPAQMAAEQLEFGIHVLRRNEDVGVLVRRSPEAEIGELAAATGPNYGRVWNLDIVEALRARFGSGTEIGGFKVPGEFGRHVPITRQNTTLYASDRDMFVFLVDEDNRIEVKDRRDGKSGSMARGFIVWNSEVGSQTLGIAMFLLDYVCMNRNIWGFRDLREIKVRHTVSAPMRWIDEVTPKLLAYANSSVGPLESAIQQAQQKKVDDVDKFLARKIDNKGLIARIKAAAMEEEGRPIETVFDAMSAVTAHAKSIPHQDDRVALERVGGSFLDLAL